MGVVLIYYYYYYYYSSNGGCRCRGGDGSGTRSDGTFHPRTVHEDPEMGWR